MNKNLLKLLGITICTLSSISAQAVPTGNLYVAFPDMPRFQIEANELIYQCLTPRAGTAAVAPAALMSALCTNSLTLNVSNTTDQAVTLRRGDNLCMDVAGGNISRGSQVNLWTCGGGNTQKWVPVAAAGDAVTLRPLGDQNLCVDISGGHTAPLGSNIILWTCSSTSPNQKITFRTTPKDVMAPQDDYKPGDRFKW